MPCFLLFLKTLATIGASALEVFTIEDSVYLAAASLTDTRSPVFIWMNGQFRLHQTVDSQQASDVVFFESGQQRYLAIASGRFFKQQCSIM